EDIFNKQVQNLFKYDELKDLYRLFDESHIKFTSSKELYSFFKKHLRKLLSIESYFKVNYLFSLLIESDKLDASDAVPYQLVSLPKDAVDNRPGFGEPKYPEGKLCDFTQNQ